MMKVLCNSLLSLVDCECHLYMHKFDVRFVKMLSYKFMEFSEKKLIL